jgi:hypothetical protein
LEARSPQDLQALQYQALTNATMETYPQPTGADVEAFCALVPGMDRSEVIARLKVSAVDPNRQI